MYGHQGGKVAGGGGGVMNWEIGIDMYTLKHSFLLMLYDNSVAKKKKDGFESQIHPLLDVLWTIHSAFSHPIPSLIR